LTFHVDLRKRVRKQTVTVRVERPRDTFFAKDTNLQRAAHNDPGIILTASENVRTKFIHADREDRHLRNTQIPRWADFSRPATHTIAGTGKRFGQPRIRRCGTSKSTVQRRFSEMRFRDPLVLDANAQNHARLYDETPRVRFENHTVFRVVRKKVDTTKM
jgi:hypothetical protein